MGKYRSRNDKVYRSIVLEFLATGCTKPSIAELCRERGVPLENFYRWLVG